MSQEIMNLLLLLAMTIVGFSVAINAKGPIRTTLSYVLAATLLIITIMVATLRWDAITGKELPKEPIKPMATVPVAPPEPPPVVIQAKPNVNAKAIARFMKEGKYWIERGIYWGNAINSFRLEELENMDDTQYDETVAVAKKHQYKAAAVLKKIKELDAPDESTKVLKDKLVQAATNLSIAGSRLNKFFSAEDAKEEDRLEEEFISYSKTAITQFNRVKPSF